MLLFWKLTLERRSKIESQKFNLHCPLDFIWMILHCNTSLLKRRKVHQKYLQVFVSTKIYFKCKLLRKLNCPILDSSLTSHQDTQQKPQQNSCQTTSYRAQFCQFRTQIWTNLWIIILFFDSVFRQLFDYFIWILISALI